MTVQTLLLITADPSHPISWQAYRYAKAFLELQREENESTRKVIEEKQDCISGLSVFFYADAANTANTLRWETSDRANLTQLWTELSQTFNLELPVCVSTALTRGITDKDNAQRHRLESHNLAEGFELVGLGELAEKITSSQKVISF